MKGIFAIMLTCFMALNVSAMELGGKISVASDNYFRGHNISDGFGYSAKGTLSHGSGLWAGGSYMSMEDDDFMYSGHVGYMFNIGDVVLNAVYSDRRIESDFGDHDWQEIGLGAEFGLFGIRYHKGLDDAGDFFAIDSDILKFVELEYGDWDDGGSYFKIHKGFDILGGKLHVGYVDHNDNADDFADKIKDLDNFYVGYSYNF